MLKNKSAYTFDCLDYFHFLYYLYRYSVVIIPNRFAAVAFM